MGNVLEGIFDAAGKVVDGNIPVESCDVGAGDAPVDVQFFGSPEGNDGGIPGRVSQDWREFADVWAAVK
jgi:hypothetical protein